MTENLNFSLDLYTSENLEEYLKASVIVTSTVVTTERAYYYYSNFFIKCNLWINKYKTTLHGIKYIL